MKSQTVRLVDVFALGPFMVWAASRTSLSPLARSVLALSGAATIIYNAHNYTELSR